MVYFIGIIEIDFILHQCQSLKEKRSIVRRLIERTKNRFNVSVAEVDYLNQCQRGKIGIAFISNDKQHANSTLDKVINFIEGLCLVDIIDTQIDFR